MTNIKCQISNGKSLFLSLSAENPFFPASKEALLPSSGAHFHRKIQIPQFELIEGGESVVSGCPAQLLFYAQQLVVFRDPVGARSGAGFDLTRVRRNGEIGDKRVFGFSGTVR